MGTPSPEQCVVFRQAGPARAVSHVPYTHCIPLSLNALTLPHTPKMWKPDGTVRATIISAITTTSPAMATSAYARAEAFALR
jgi:hypothetical protein